MCRIAREGGLSFLEVPDPLFLFPEHILRLLVFIEQAIDADVGGVEDIAAVHIVGPAVARRVLAEAVEGDVLAEQDGIELDDLVLAEVELLLERLQLADGSLGGRQLAGGLGGVDGLGPDRDADSGQDRQGCEG